MTAARLDRSCPLSDKDVFVLDAMASPPPQLASPAGLFQHDLLRRRADGFHPVTFTCVPTGSGAWDGDERDAHTDPTDPHSTP